MTTELNELDITKYSELKASKTLQFAKVGPLYAAVLPRYDSQTGTPIDPQFVAIKRSDVERISADLEARLASVKELLADMDALA